LTRYRVLDPSYDGDDVLAALEAELNQLSSQGWRLVAVVPVRSFRKKSGGEVEVSEDAIDALVLERSESSPGHGQGHDGQLPLALAPGLQGPGD
jgi:hypothetical protein